MKKLPKIYKNEIDKKINNNKNICYVEKEDSVLQKNTKEQITETIEEIFSGIGYSYNIPVTIKTSNKTYETSLIAKTKNSIITLDNETIPLETIISIQKKKN